MKNFLIFVVVSAFVLFTMGCTKVMPVEPAYPTAIATATATTVIGYQIDSVSPSTATIGSTVTIHGANFDQYALVALSNPNGGPESTADIVPTSISPNVLTFVVPATNDAYTNYGYSNSTLGVNYVQVFANAGQGGGGLTMNLIILNVTP